MTTFKKYIYDGPVMNFDTCIANHWHAETMAVSKDKAKSNLKYRYKKIMKLSTNMKIELPGKLTIVD